MLPKVIKISLLLISWGIFGYTIFKVSYPESLTTAHPYQMAFFFFPLFIGISLLFSFKFNFFSSSAIGLGAIILLILKAFDSLNFATAILTIIATLLLFSSFRNKNQKIKSKSGLNKRTNRSKLTRKL